MFTKRLANNRERRIVSHAHLVAHKDSAHNVLRLLLARMAWSPGMG